jgi:hypothetical protein
LLPPALPAYVRQPTLVAHLLTPLSAALVSYRITYAGQAHADIMVNNPDAAAGVPDITEAVPVNEKTAPAVTTATKKHRFVLQPKEEAAAAAAAAAPKKASAIEKSAGAAAASANSQPFDTS